MSLTLPAAKARTLLVIAAVLLRTALTVPAAEPADPANEPAVLAVGKALPAVVNINTEAIIRRQVADPFDEFVNRYFGGPVSRPLTVKQKVQSLGTGFIVDPSGYIVTNQHVVARATDLKISVTTNTGKTYSARYIAGAPESDLALIKIDGKEPFPHIDLNNLSPNFLGETVLVLGNPLGYGSSVARGIVSAKGRTVTVENLEYKDLIQTDAAINPGNSGGPLIDIAGRLVGVSSVKMAFTPQGVPTQGLGFAIPGEVVRKKVEEFKRSIAAAKSAPTPKADETAGTQAHRYFGLELQDLTPELSETFNLKPGAGVLIAEVEPNSPASEAGIERGLVIYEVGRYPVASIKQIEELLESIRTGSLVDFSVGAIRRGRQLQRQLQVVTLRAR